MFILIKMPCAPIQIFYTTVLYSRKKHVNNILYDTTKIVVLFGYIFYIEPRDIYVFKQKSEVI